MKYFTGQTLTPAEIRELPAMEWAISGRHILPNGALGVASRTEIPLPVIPDRREEIAQKVERGDLPAPVVRVLNEWEIELTFGTHGIGDFYDILVEERPEPADEPEEGDKEMMDFPWQTGRD